MTVKRIRSASRVLDLLEAVARHQPVGLGELARLADTDKSAVQRAVATLADEGWIQRAVGRTGEWRVGARFRALAQLGLGPPDLRERVVPVLHRLRDDSGEATALTVLDQGQLILCDVAESRQMLRFTPPTGVTVPLQDSASARAILAWSPLERVRALLGGLPSAELLEHLRRARSLGYTISESFPGAVTVGAPIFGADGLPEAALLLVAPRERLPLERIPAAGAMVVQAARVASAAAPAATANPETPSPELAA